MSSILEQIRAQAELAAQTGPDMTEVQTGGGKELPVGVAMARLVGYVEIGSQPQEYGGVAKDPKPEFILTFALTGAAPNPTPGGAPLPYTNEDGSPYLLSTYPISLSRNEKAGAFLMFKAMNYKGTATHFAQLIGEAFLLPIVAVKKGDKTTNRADMKGIRPPYAPDPISGQMTMYPVAEPREQDLKLFLWQHPTLEAFNSLKQEGEWENKAADGTITKQSKNKVQEAMLGATDFSGSALELLLKTNNVAYTIPAKKAAAVAPAVPGAVAPALPGAVAPAAPAVAPVAAAPSVVVPVQPAVIAPPTVAPAAVVPTTAPVIASVAPPVAVVAPAVAAPVVVNLPPALAA